MDADGEETLRRFYAEVQRITDAVQRVKSATAELKTLQDEAVWGEGEGEGASEKLARVIVQANKDCALAKRVLENLPKLRAARIRENAHAAALHSLVGAVRGFQAAQVELKLRLREKAARRVRIVKPDATDEEIGIAIRSGDVNAVYRTAILEPGSNVIAAAYLDAADRYRDVLALEKSVDELHRMFMDLALLVNQQGLILDTIESNVFKAKERVEDGRAQLEKAMKARIVSRRRTCCCIVLVVVILAVVLGPVLGALH